MKCETSQPETFTNLEAAKLLLDEWKFRHAHIWSALTRYYIGAVAVSLVPYGLNSIELTVEQTSEIRPYVVWFPIAGGILGIAAVWMYYAEYIRMKSPLTEYKKILKKNERFTETPLGWFRWLFDLPIGPATAVFLFVATVALAIGNAYVAYQLWH